MIYELALACSKSKKATGALTRIRDKIRALNSDKRFIELIRLNDRVVALKTLSTLIPQVMEIISQNPYDNREDLLNGPAAGNDCQTTF